MVKQRDVMITVITVATLLLAIGLIFAYKHKEKYNNFQHYKVGRGYDYPDPLILPPNPPTDGWFEPDAYTRPVSQSGMDLAPSTLKGPPIGSGIGAHGVGYSDDRTW